jgi:phosphate transport system substrate-binding protein
MNVLKSYLGQLSALNKWLLSFTACAVFISSSAYAQKALVKVDGSSTVFPVTEAVAEEFQIKNKGNFVTVGISGTGGGFKKFCRGETDIQNASRPILSGEMEECRKAGVRYIELPIAYDAIVVAVNPKNEWLKSITVEELKKIWSPESQGKIMRWNQVNPNWPDAPMKLFGAGADSGTFDYFTEAIVGKAKASRGDFTGSEDDNTLVLGISSDVNSLGFLPFSYYEENKGRLRALPILGGTGAPKKTAIAPSKESVEDGSYFPLARPIFIYINIKSLDRPEVSRFANFYIDNVTRLAAEVRYVPLPKNAYQMISTHLKNKRAGTAFGGHPEVGLKIADLLKREPKE